MIKTTLTLLTSLLIFSPSVIAVTPTPENPLIAQESYQERLQNYAQQITVKITTGDNAGSGTLIGKQGNTYLVLTNAHVMRRGNTAKIQTYDGKTHNATLYPHTFPNNYDLAILQFTSEDSYTVADIATFTPKPQLEIFAAGYSVDKGEFTTTSGNIAQIPNKPLKEGYNIGYTNNIQQGMSGGPILEARTFALLGINGRAANPILNSGYTYDDGSKPTPAELEQMRSISWGVSINVLLTQLPSETLTAFNLPQPETPTAVETPTTLTGWIGDLETKAKQFTVRIDSSSGANGSGVIIGKQGNTYTILTADHVLCETPVGSRECIPHDYTILTHDGKIYPIKKGTLQRREGVDLAVVEFESQENYPVATLANYNPTTADYVFVAGYPKVTQKTPQWRFSGGQVFGKEQGLLESRQDDFQTAQTGSLQGVSSLTGGYELVYTSITYGGMSGGPVLDSQGRVIGIHGRAEGESNIPDVGQIQLGYSLGVSISTFIGLAPQVTPKLRDLSLETNTPSPLDAQKTEEMNNTILNVNAPQGNAKANIWIERGNQLWRLNKYQEAVTAFDQAIAQNPPYVHLAYYGKGVALAYLGKSPEALTALSEALKHQPDYYEALYIQSIIYRQSGPYELALTAIEKAIALQPQNPNLYNEKFVVLLPLKRYPEALEAINQAIKLAPRAAFYSNRGYAYSDLQEYEKAIAEYNQALSLNPQFAEVYDNRGAVYLNLQQYEKAITDFTQALSINPQYAGAYYNRGNAYYSLQEYEKALAEYTQAISINPQYVDAYNNRGNTYRNLKQYEKAIADYTQAISINSQYAKAYNNRGLAYADLQEYEKALADFNKALSINPQYADAYTSRGNAYYSLQEYEKALADYTQAISINPQYALAYTNRGNAYAILQQYEKAIADFNQAISINPQYADAYTNRGLAYYSLQQYEKAIADYTQAIAINPQYAQAYQNRGAAYGLSGQEEKGIQDLKTAAELYRQQGNMAAYEKIMAVLQQLGQ